MRVLVVNAGSSSLKLRLLGGDDAVEQTADTDPGGDLEAVLRDWPQPDAVGHRVVHGGTRFRDRATFFNSLVNSTRCVQIAVNTGRSFQLIERLQT